MELLIDNTTENLLSMIIYVGVFTNVSKIGIIISLNVSKIWSNYLPLQLSDHYHRSCWCNSWSMRGVSLYYIHGVKAISQVKTPIYTT